MDAIDVRVFEFFIKPSIERTFSGISENEKQKRVRTLESIAEELNKNSAAYQLMLVVIEISKEYLYGKE